MRKLRRILAMSLCLISATSFISQAATCDDVRQLYGGLPLDRQEYLDFIEYVDTLGQIQGKRENAASMLNTQDRLAALQSSYQEITIERDGVVEDLSALMRSDGDVMDVIGKARELVSLTDKVESINFIDADNEEGYDVSSQNYNELNDSIGNDRLYINDNYNIGELSAEWPVDTYKNKAVMGFGPNGVYIDAKDASTVTALYTGIVTKVEKSEEYGNWIEIQSGKGLKVTYSFLHRVRVRLGDRVAAGSSIAHGCDDNKLYIEMNLDGEYVNPMLALGKDGVKANNDWIYNHVGESDTSMLLSISSYDYTPMERIWDTK